MNALLKFHIGLNYSLEIDRDTERERTGVYPAKRSARRNALSTP